LGGPRVHSPNALNFRLSVAHSGVHPRVSPTQMENRT
jgi:hypothetical protein